MSNEERATAIETIDKWLALLEAKAEELLAAAIPADMDAYQSAQAAGKFIVLIAKLIELRRLLDDTPPDDREQALLNAILYGVDANGLPPLVNQ